MCLKDVFCPDNYGMFVIKYVQTKKQQYKRATGWVKIII